MTEATTEGGCQCGAVRYRIAGAPLVVALCHCRSCRRAHAAPAVAWAMYQAGQVDFHGQAPAGYESSPGALRRFCARCGTQVGFTADYLPGLLDIPVGSLDHPAQLPPVLHYWDTERLPWLQLADGLPRHEAFPPFG